VSPRAGLDAVARRRKFLHCPCRELKNTYYFKNLESRHLRRFVSSAVHCLSVLCSGTLGAGHDAMGSTDYRSEILLRRNLTHALLMIVYEVCEHFIQSAVVCVFCMAILTLG
jgi:hypothetical protein